MNSQTHQHLPRLKYIFTLIILLLLLLPFTVFATPASQTSLTGTAEISATLQNAASEQYLLLTPTQYDVTVTLKITYGPQDDWRVAGKVGLWVLSEQGLRDLRDGSKASQVAIAAGNTVAGKGDYRKSTSFMAVGRQTYTVMVYSDAPVPTSYTITAENATLVDPNAGTRVEQIQEVEEIDEGTQRTVYLAAQGGQTFLAVIPDAKGSDISIELDYVPKNNGALTGNVKLFVFDNAGLRTFQNGDRPEAVSFAAGITESDQPAGPEEPAAGEEPEEEEEPTPAPGSTATPTEEPDEEELTPVPGSTATPAVSVTATPTEEPDEEEPTPAASVTATPTEEPDEEEPTPQTTPAATGQPTATPTAASTAAPTAVTTPEPTPEPTEEEPDEPLRQLRFKTSQVQLRPAIFLLPANQQEEDPAASEEEPDEGIDYTHLTANFTAIGTQAYTIMVINRSPVDAVVTITLSGAKFPEEEKSSNEAVLTDLEGNLGEQAAGTITNTTNTQSVQTPNTSATEEE